MHNVMELNRQQKDNKVHYKRHGAN